MSDEYTPTTNEVREEFIYGHQEVDIDGNVVVSFDEAQARWDRWLTEVERAAAEKAWDEGFSRGFYRGQILSGDYDASEAGISNPYEEKNDE